MFLFGVDAHAYKYINRNHRNKEKNKNVILTIEKRIIKKKKHTQKPSRGRDRI